MDPHLESRRAGSTPASKDHMATATVTERSTGKVVQVIGPVVDIEFEGGHLPSIYNDVRVTPAGEPEGEEELR